MAKQDNLIDGKKAEAGVTIEEFFKMKDLEQKNARVYVQIHGEYGPVDKKTGKAAELVAPKTIKVGLSYWNSVLKSDQTQEPFESQELIGYELTEGTEKKLYSFTKK